MCYLWDKMCTCWGICSLFSPSVFECMKSDMTSKDALCFLLRFSTICLRSFPWFLMLDCCKIIVHKQTISCTNPFWWLATSFCLLRKYLPRLEVLNAERLKFVPIDIGTAKPPFRITNRYSDDGCATWCAVVKRGTILFYISGSLV